MKKYANKPNLNTFSKIYPVAVDVPRGFRTHAQTVCQKKLGRSYCQYTPQRRIQSGVVGVRRQFIFSRAWTKDETARWHYDNGKLYFKNERDALILTVIMLTKP